MSKTDTFDPMIEPERKAGKRGLRIGEHVPELALARFALPASKPPATGDCSHGIVNWGMLGNDTYGNCGPCATEHYREAKAGAIIDTITTAYTEGLYFKYGKAMGEAGTKPDQGVSNASWLKFLFDLKLIDGYAEITDLSPDSIHAAMLNFSGVLVGVSLTDDAEQLFENHEPWTTAQGEHPDQNEGHDICLVKYDEQFDYFVTWGALQPATIPWDSACIGDAWVIITSEDADRNGIDLAALRAEIQNLGGSVAAAVPPKPAPAPAPAPAVDYTKAYVGARSALSAAAAAIHSSRIAINEAHADESLPSSVRVILQRMDAPLRHEEGALNTYLASAPSLP